MPRIAAALGVFVAASCSIGLNMARYPVVWDMTGPALSSTQAEQTAPPASPAPITGDVGPAPKPADAAATPAQPSGKVPAAANEKPVGAEKAVAASEPKAKPARPPAGNQAAAKKPAGKGGASGQDARAAAEKKPSTAESAPPLIATGPPAASGSPGDDGEPLAQYRRERSPPLPQGEGRGDGNGPAAGNGRSEAAPLVGNGKRLVPIVAPDARAAKPATAASETVVRLPAAEPMHAGVNDPSSVLTLMESLPLYPTTGIE